MAVTRPNKRSRLADQARAAARYALPRDVVSHGSGITGTGARATAFAVRNSMFAGEQLNKGVGHG